MDDDEYQRAWNAAYDAMVEEVERKVHKETGQAMGAAVPHLIQRRRTIRRDYVGTIR